MSDYEVGDVAHLTATFTDSTGALVDPATVSLTVRLPDGTQQTPNPAHDSTGQYHYDLLLASSGRYAWRWLSSLDRASAEEGELNVAATLLYDRPEHMPGPSDVAALLRARIRTPGGQPSDVFTDSTNPTRAQVQNLIDTHASLMLVSFGDLSDAALICGSASEIRTAVRALIATRVAAAVEASYWPGNSADTTAQDAWERLTDADLPRVIEAARECRLGEDVPGGSGSGEGGIAMAPRYSFQQGPRVGTRRW